MSNEPVTSPAAARVEVQRVDAALVTLEFEGEREARDEPDVADSVVHEFGSASAKGPGLAGITASIHCIAFFQLPVNYDTNRLRKSVKAL